MNIKKKQIKLDIILNFITRWFFSTNHKDIGTLYLLFSIFAGVMGTWFSILIRSELVYLGMQYFNGNWQSYNVIIINNIFLKKKTYINFFCKNINYNIVRIFNRSILQKKNLIKKNFKRCYFTKPKLIKKGIIELNKALKIYEKEYLQSKKNLEVVFLIIGFFFLFIGSKIVFVYSSFAYITAFFAFLWSFFLNLFITYKRIQFIYNYPLDCNPQKFVRALLSFFFFSIPLLKYLAAIGGFVLSLHYFIKELSGVNIIQEIYKNYINDNKSVSDIVYILKEKLSKGNHKKD